jgi:transcriptional regulator with XRE-family HTH domain/AcrR family transcriptional regulator
MKPAAKERASRPTLAASPVRAPSSDEWDARREQHEPVDRYRYARVPELRRCRERLGRSLRSLATQVPMPAPTLARVERGVLRASSARQERLAEIFGVGVDAIFCPAEPPPLEERNRQIVDLYRDGLTTEQVGNRVGLSKSRVRRILEQSGQPRRAAKQRRAASVIDEIVRRYIDEQQGTPTIARELGIPRSTVALYLAQAGVVMRPPGGRRKHPRPRPRRCAHCDRWFTPPDAAQVARGDGRFCTRLCARRDERARESTRAASVARHRALKAAADQIRAADDAMTTADVAEELRISPNTVLRYIRDGKLRAQLHAIEGERIYFIKRANFDRFKQEEWPRRWKAVEDNLAAWGAYPPGWSRQSRLRWQGRQGGPRGAAAGIEMAWRSLGRPPLSTPEQQQEMLRLHREGLPSRKIAESVFGDPKYKDRVRRFLNR